MDNKDIIAIKILSFYGIMATICDASNHVVWVKDLLNFEDQRITLVDQTLKANSNHTYLSVIT